MYSHGTTSGNPEEDCQSVIATLQNYNLPTIPLKSNIQHCSYIVTHGNMTLKESLNLVFDSFSHNVSLAKHILHEAAPLFLLPDLLQPQGQQDLS